MLKITFDGSADLSEDLPLAAGCSNSLPEELRWPSALSAPSIRASSVLAWRRRTCRSCLSEADLATRCSEGESACKAGQSVTCLQVHLDQAQLHGRVVRTVRGLQVLLDHARLGNTRQQGGDGLDSRATHDEAVCPD